jgi:hypothetical protein
LDIRQTAFANGILDSIPGSGVVGVRRE